MKAMKTITMKEFVESDAPAALVNATGKHAIRSTMYVIKGMKNLEDDLVTTPVFGYSYYNSIPNKLELLGEILVTKSGGNIFVSKENYYFEDDLTIYLICLVRHLEK